jgi:hypothetical protein
MRHQTNRRVIALVLTAIAIGLFLVLPAPSIAKTAPCCQTCDRDHDSCVAICNGDPDCIANCDRAWMDCWHFCVTCESGNECINDNQCSPGYVCCGGWCFTGC